MAQVNDLIEGIDYIDLVFVTNLNGFKYTVARIPNLYIKEFKTTGSFIKINEGFVFETIYLVFDSTKIDNLEINKGKNVMFLMNNFSEAKLTHIDIFYKDDRKSVSLDTHYFQSYSINEKDTDIIINFSP